MKKCKVIKEIQGQRAIDGAGVSLVRVFGKSETQAFDPFLMLDSFDSVDSSDYVAGFPMHPHRGIETITYLISGEIEHEDSLGNKGTIGSGQAQWMTAGSGILHQEMPKKSDRMLGLQLWLNLPQAEKMVDPQYLGIVEDQIPLKVIDGAEVRVISGKYEDSYGITPNHIAATIYDIKIEKGASIDIPTKPDETTFVFLIEGNGIVDGKEILSKTAVLFDKGDVVTIAAPANKEVRLLFFSAKPLGESIAWGGPIVMNTKEELSKAFSELEQGTFIKHK